MLLRTATLSLLALAMGSSAAWATDAQVAQRPDVTLALANNLLSATLAACHADGRTALSTKTSTRLLSERARNNPDAENLNTLDELLLLGGGVPLTVGNQVIGAIGVAGAGGAEIDEGCALKAIAQILPTTH